MTESEYYTDRARMNQTDYQSELQEDLKMLVDTMFLWTDVEAAWEFPEEFTKEFEAWLKKKTIEAAEALMEINP